MKGHRWSCVLGLLCMHAEVILSTLTVFQSPSSISHLRLNSTAEITCAISSSSPDVMGFYLRGRFRDRRDIIFLTLNQGKVGKNTTAENFKDRIKVTQNPNREGIKITLKLLLLGLDDTDLYYCEWKYLNNQNSWETQHSNGTILIIRDFIPQEECQEHILDHILISLSVAAFTVVLFLAIGGIILKCRRFKKRFTPARPPPPPRPTRPHHVCPPHSVQQVHYLLTSENPLDYRDIL